MLDMIEPALANEAMLRTLANDPIDPIDSAEPTEPMLSTQLRDPMDSSELVDPMLQRDVVRRGIGGVAMGSSCRFILAGARCPPHAGPMTGPSHLLRQ